MDVKWGSLGDVCVAGLGITVLVVVVFSLGVMAWARSGGGTSHPAPRTGRERLAAGVALLCFGVCLAVAGYGIALIVPG